jgi:hypothetical protein
VPSGRRRTTVGVPHCCASGPPSAGVAIHGPSQGVSKRLAEGRSHAHSIRRSKTPYRRSALRASPAANGRRRRRAPEQNRPFISERGPHPTHEAPRLPSEERRLAVLARRSPVAGIAVGPRTLAVTRIAETLQARRF